MSSASGRTEYPLLGQNKTVSSNQAIRIYAAASAGHVSADKGISPCKYREWLAWRTNEITRL
jgi:hypothetical protein